MKKIVVWGTGKKATKFMETVNRWNEFGALFCKEPIFEIEFFIDSLKNEGLFFNKKIVLPSEVDLNIVPFIVVAVVNDRDIKEILDTQKLRLYKDYILYGDISNFFSLENEICEQICYFLDITSTKTTDLETSVCSQLKMIISNIKLIQNEQFEKYKDMIMEWILRRAYILIRDKSKKLEIASVFMESIGIAQYNVLLEKFFQTYITKAAEWMPKRKCICNDYSKKVIGLYYLRLYNGGVERVISRLIPIFIKRGYKVILFTDEIDEEKEYPISNETIRVCLGKKYASQERYEKIMSAIKCYKIDIFCYHAYAGRALYDLFFVNQQGIPIVVEYHNIFTVNVFEMSFGEASSICKFADALVTLSKIDALFWRFIGVKSIYIPNPTDTSLKNVMGCQDYNILWIQRINQSQKQVLDLPDILMYITEVLPNVKLTIVGESDTPELENKLRYMFSERGLDDNVSFEGYKKNVEQYYEKAAVVLITSAFEGFSMVIYESKKYGIPIVMYEMPYLEMLKDRKGYIEVLQNDKRGFANAVIKILCDKDLRRKLSKEAKESIEQFSKDNIIEKWEQAFRICSDVDNKIVLSDEELKFKEIQLLLMKSIDKVKQNYSGI